MHYDCIYRALCHVVFVVKLAVVYAKCASMSIKSVCWLCRRLTTEQEREDLTIVHEILFTTPRTATLHECHWLAFSWGARIWPRNIFRHMHDQKTECQIRMYLQLGVWQFSCKCTLICSKEVLQDIYCAPLQQAKQKRACHMTYLTKRC